MSTPTRAENLSLWSLFIIADPLHGLCASQSHHKPGDPLVNVCSMLFNLVTFWLSTRDFSPMCVQRYATLPRLMAVGIANCSSSTNRNRGSLGGRIDSRSAPFMTATPRIGRMTSRTHPIPSMVGSFISDAEGPEKWWAKEGYARAVYDAAKAVPLKKPLGMMHAAAKAVPLTPLLGDRNDAYCCKMSTVENTTGGQKRCSRCKNGRFISVAASPDRTDRWRTGNLLPRPASQF
jgi:hypothetical protein